MKITKFDTFGIVLATNIKLKVTNFRSGDELFFYEISSEGIIHGNLFPTINGISSQVIWNTFDNIDPLLVSQIGEAIERHYLYGS